MEANSSDLMEIILNFCKGCAEKAKHSNTTWTIENTEDYSDITDKYTALEIEKCFRTLIRDGYIEGEDLTNTKTFKGLTTYGESSLELIRSNKG